MSYHIRSHHFILYDINKMYTISYCITYIYNIISHIKSHHIISYHVCYFPKWHGNCCITSYVFWSCLMIMFAQTIWWIRFHTISATLWTSLDRTPCLWSILVVYCNRDSSSTMSLENYSTKVLLSILPLKVDTTYRKSRQMTSTDKCFLQTTHITYLHVSGWMFWRFRTIYLSNQFLYTVETITPFINRESKFPQTFHSVKSHQQRQRLEKSAFVYDLYFHIWTVHLAFTISWISHQQCQCEFMFGLLKKKYYLRRWQSYSFFRKRSGDHQLRFW